MAVHASRLPHRSRKRRKRADQGDFFETGRNVTPPRGQGAYRHHPFEGVSRGRRRPAQGAAVPPPACTWQDAVSCGGELDRPQFGHLERPIGVVKLSARNGGVSARTAVAAKCSRSNRQWPPTVVSILCRRPLVPLQRPAQRLAENQIVPGAFLRDHA